MTIENTQDAVVFIQKQGKALENLRHHLKHEYHYFGDGVDRVEPSATNPEYLLKLGAFLALQNVLEFDKSWQFDGYCLKNLIPENLCELLRTNFGKENS
ncbi:MAG: hypothetical protein AAGF26_11180 [Cyanobacteria bacterium P01_G01_bin.49]